jgi:hypothetical protein
MSDDWDFYFLRVDDEPASIFVDLGVRDDAPVMSHPSMAYLRVQMLRPRHDGLSSQDEYEDLIALEDRVATHIVKDAATIYVGRNTSGGMRDFYFYVADPAEFESAVRVAMRRLPTYTYEVGSREDPDWRTYLEFLYPSDVDMHRIMNRRVCERLESHGDNITNARQIDHVAFVPSREAQSTFSRHVQAEGFTIGRAPRESTDDGQFTVEFSRVDPPAHIDDIVIALFEKIVELGGEYDGWGCSVSP